MPHPTQTQKMIDNTFATALFMLAGTIGTQIWVDSGASLTTGQGTRDAPYTTLATAFNNATANSVILVKAGHAETITAAAGIDADVDGVTVIGLGSGSNRPTFTFSTATTADIDIDAGDITFKNLRFVSAIDSLAVMLDVNDSNFTIENCEFYGPATFECLNFINLATTKDNFVIRGCWFHQDADPAGTDDAAATGGIYFVDSENILIEDCIFDGFFETACIHNKTTACKYVTVRRCSLNQQLANTGRMWRFPTGTTGVHIDHASIAQCVPGLGYRVTKTEDVNTATSDDLFTTTGKVLIRLWTGEVTNALDAAVTDYQITLTTLAGVVVAAGNIASAIVGHIFTLNADAGDTSLSTSTSAVSVAGVGDTQGKTGHIVVGSQGLAADTLKAVRTAGAAGDAILHDVYWLPLEVGAHMRTAA